MRQQVTAAPAEPEKKKKTIKLAMTATVTTKNGPGRLFIANAQTGEDITNVGADGDRLEIPAGAYRLRYGAFDTTTVEIKAGETATIDANSWTARATTRNGAGRLFIGDPETGDDITNIAADGDSFQLPAGTYRLRYGPFEARTIDVKAGEAVTIDAKERTATLTTRHGAGRLFIADAQTGADITNISADGDTIQVTPGTYKLRFGQFDAGTIEVAAGDDIVIE